MDAKRFIKEYFSFTRKERIAVVIIAGLIVLIFFVPIFTRNGSTIDIRQDTAWQAAMYTLPAKNDDSAGSDVSRTILIDETARGSKNDAPDETQLFYFDPNTASANDWKRLGLTEKQIRIIGNYLAKKGVFRKPEDLKRIYGISTTQYEALAPYIRIKSFSREDVNEKAEQYESKKASQPPTHSRFTIIDINSADTSMLISLPGIGSKLAARIINFREKLGGFYSVDQVSETFGLPDSVFQKIKTQLQCADNGIIKININNVTAEELKTHPYFRWKIANAVVQYRNQHGAFTSPDDLRKVNVLDDALLNKIKPYLSF